MNAKKRCMLRERKSEQEWRKGSGEGKGVNFDMSFLKLSFDN